jgi:hypothetical protein
MVSVKPSVAVAAGTRVSVMAGRTLTAILVTDWLH